MAKHRKPVVNSAPDDLSAYYANLHLEACEHMTPEPELIGRAEALEMLQKPIEHLGKPSRQVLSIKRDILSRRWVANGQTAGLDSGGHVLNGEYRLHAIVLAGVAVPLSVVRGVSRSALPTIDACRPRNGATVLREANYSNAGIICSAIHLLTVVRGVYQQEFVGEDLDGVLPDYARPRVWFSNQEVLEITGINPGLAESARLAGRLSKDSRVPRGVLSCAHYLCTMRGRKDLDLFFDTALSDKDLDSSGDEARLKSFLDTAQAPVGDWDRMTMVAKIVLAAKMKVGLADRSLDLEWAFDGPYKKPFPRVL